MFWILLALAALVALVTVPRVIASITILEYERALKFVRGRYVDLVEPGLYWYSRRTTSFRRVDTRPTHLTVSGQEVLSSDGVAIKVSVLAIYRVVDPKAAVLGIDDFAGAVHAQLQLALRAVVAGSTAEDLLQKRNEIPSQLLAIAAPPLLQLGLELQTASLRDLTLPGDLKKIFSQVVRARQDGLAALEKARGETAALRNLANAAQMIQRNPQLLQLRLLQVLEQQPGHTVVLGVPSGVVPVPASRDSSPGVGEGHAGSVE
jgi:regulator of protease activity HflC (stomatin/prohibitin superfamily)